MNQKANLPIVTALEKYIDANTVRFHMPGHKGRGTNNYLKEFLGQQVFAADVTNVPTMDDLHQTTGVIKNAQELAAQTFGADQTYFLVNGSSCGLQALVATVCQPGDKIIVPRNIHRSILSGIILIGAIPIFFMPEYDAEYNLPLGAQADSIVTCLTKHPDSKAVLVVNPTYHGITSDIANIAQLVHQHQLPLLVDEAHGPHLGFHPNLPPASLSLGADAVVHGTHKILSAFTQASMLHVKGDRINRQRLAATLKLLQSTSTSYLLLASLDAARAEMATCGQTLLGKALDSADYLRQSLQNLAPFSCLSMPYIQQRGAWDLDRTKVTISLKGLKVTGLWAENWLRKHFNIQVEMSDLTNLLLIISPYNQLPDLDYFLQALHQMSQAVATSPPSNLPDQSTNYFQMMPPLPELVLSPREAFVAPVMAVPLEYSIGKISNETIACYPPGIPVLCPGERITKEIVDYLTLIKSLGMHVQGCYDASLQQIFVVK